MSKRVIDDALIAYVDPADTFITDDGKTRLAPPLEDYSIYVSLKVCAKGKNYGMSTDEGTYQLIWESGQKRTIRDFISGTHIEDTSPNSRTTLKYLTSDGTEFVYGDIRDGKVDTHEMLGISNINIDYTNFFVPQITIQFVDVHGASLFGPETEYHTDGYVTAQDQWGNETQELRTGLQRNDIQAPFLHAFFTFPYPNYRLEIKGLYGYAVSYDLTMSNWTSSFDSSTGNFNVTATLIGYTYSFLNDLTMSAIITSSINGYEGYSYWENVIRKNVDRYYVLGKNSENQEVKYEIPRIATIMGALKDAQLAIQKAKKEHEDNYQGITNVPSGIEQLNAQLASLVKNVCDGVKNSHVNFDQQQIGSDYFVANSNNGAVILIKKGKEEYEWEDKDAEDENRRSGTTNVVKLITDEFKHQASTLNQDFSAFVSPYMMGESAERANQEGIKTLLFDKQNDVYIDFQTGTTADIRMCELYKGMPDDGKSMETNSINLALEYSGYTDGTAIIINLIRAKKRAREAHLFASAANDARAKALDEEIKEIYKDKLGFTPTIRNVMSIIFAHVETFMHCMDKIREGVMEAMKDEGPRSYEKVSTLLNIKASTDLKEDKYGLPPFPLAVVKNFRNQEEKTWLGEIPFAYIEKKPEVDFIEGALTSVDQFHKILDESGLDGGNSTVPTVAGEDRLPDLRGDLWHIPFPICPFDFANTTKIYPTNRHADASPWGQQLTTDPEDLAFRMNNRIKMIGKVRMNQRNNHKLISQIYGLIDAQNFYDLHQDELDKALVQQLGNIKDRIVPDAPSVDPVFFNGNYDGSIACKEGATGHNEPSEFIPVGERNNCKSSSIRYVKNTLKQSTTNQADFKTQAYDVLITKMDGVAQFSAYATGWKDLSTLQEKHNAIKYTGQTEAGEENRIGYTAENLQYFGQKMYQALHDEEKEPKIENIYYGTKYKSWGWQGWERFKIRDRGFTCISEEYGRDLLMDPDGKLVYTRADEGGGYGENYKQDIYKAIINEFRRGETDANYTIGSDSGLYYSVFSDSIRNAGYSGSMDQFPDFVAKMDSLFPSIFGSERYCKVESLQHLTALEKQWVKAFMFLNSLNITNDNYEENLADGCITLPKALVLNYGSYVAMYRLIRNADGTINRDKCNDLTGVIFNKVDDSGNVTFFNNMPGSHSASSSAFVGNAMDGTYVNYACQYKFTFNKKLTIEPKETTQFANEFNTKMMDAFTNWVSVGLDITPDSFTDIENMYSYVRLDQMQSLITEYARRLGLTDEQSESMLGTVGVRAYGKLMYEDLVKTSDYKTKKEDLAGKTSFVTSGAASDDPYQKPRVFASIDKVKEAEQRIGFHCIDFEKFEKERSGVYCEMIGFDCVGNIYALNSPAPKDTVNPQSRMIMRLLLQPYLISIPQLGMDDDDRIDLETAEYYEAFAYEVQRLYGLREEEYKPTITYDENGNVVSTVASNPRVPKEVKVALYNYLKNLYDRWLDNPWDDGVPVYASNSTLASSYGMDYFMGVYNPSTGQREGGHFIFIDSYYNKLDDYLNINLTEFIRQIQYALEVENRTLLQFITELLAKHKMNVQCIQNFADLSSTGRNRIVEKLFTPIPLSRKGITDPRSYFIALYAGEPAQNSISKDKKDDGLYLTGPNENIKKVKIPIHSQGGGYRIPAFAVAYGDQYQHYFQDINVGMSTSLATEQSIKTQFDLAKMANTENDVQALGQDLYTVYSNNSYECTIKMLGCPWIQPVMYFEMLNIPMFNGAYMVKRVNHNIMPGYMETTLHGIRQNRLSSPYIDVAVITNEHQSSTSFDEGGTYPNQASAYRMELTYEYYTADDVASEIPEDREEEMRELSDNAYTLYYRIKKSIEACEWARNMQGEKFNVEVVNSDTFLFKNCPYKDVIFDLILKKYDKDVARLCWVADGMSETNPRYVMVSAERYFERTYEGNGGTFRISGIGEEKGNTSTGCQVLFLTGELEGLMENHYVDANKPSVSFTGPLFAKYISKISQDEYTGNKDVLNQRVGQEIEEMTVERLKNMSQINNYPILADRVEYVEVSENPDTTAEQLHTYLVEGGRAFQMRLGGISMTGDAGTELPFWGNGEIILGDGRLACFTVNELCYSEKAVKNHIENKPDTEAQYKCLEDLIKYILQPLCDKYGKNRVKVNSGYRNKRVNELVSGSTTSQHSKGQALDLKLKGSDGTSIRNAELFAFIVEKLQFDQIIWEKGGQWVHVSFNAAKNRKLICEGPINGRYPVIANNWITKTRWDGRYTFNT